MSINLKDSAFWGELGIKYGGDLNKSLDDFYKIYQKTLRDRGYPKSREKSLEILKKSIQTNRDILLEVYLTHLEKTLSFLDPFKIKANELDI